METDYPGESPQTQCWKLREQALKARHYARMFMGNPVAERLEEWARELTAEAASIAASLGLE